MNRHDQTLPQLEADLRRAIGGKVHFDRLTRQLYSTDASSYRLVPQGVVIPRAADDVAATLELAARHDVAITARGGGSSLAGQAVGSGLVLDYSRYFDRILEINPAEKQARVEPGVVLNQLNAALHPHGLMVGPDPSSGPVATLGGMAANNATGVHSIRYGLMVDHVQAVSAVLADGRQAEFGPKTAAEVAQLAQADTLEGRLYRDIPALLERYQADIAAGYPQTWRNVAGYNLNRLLAQRQAGEPFNLTPLLVGSEGTLAQLTNLTIKLVERPAHTRLLILPFAELRPTLEIVPRLLEHQPTAIEMLNRHLIRLAREHPGFRPRINRFVPGDPAALLIVELAGDSLPQLAAQAEILRRALAGWGYRGDIVDCTAPDDIANVWKVRGDSLGLVMSLPGDAKPLAFVDDAAVPVAELPDYVAAVEQACREAGVEVSFDSHASAGCLHVTPVINLKTEDGLRRMQTISQAVMQIAIAHHGTTSGEHGEGLARSYYNEQLYGPALHQAFRQIKHLFDPDNRLNPGKIIDGPEPWQPDILRFSSHHPKPPPVQTFFDYAPHQNMAGLVEMCNGQGLCRSREADTMCPAFRATRAEMHTTRGRANALRAALSGELGPAGLTDHSLYEALDLCLECKACKTECSTGVDMAKLKYEFLAHYQAEHGLPLRSRLFGHIAALNRLGSLVPALTNRLYTNRLVRAVLDRTLGIDRRRTMPKIASQPFQGWFQRWQSPVTGQRGEVILWDDTYLTYNQPELGRAAVRVLEAAGFRVRLIEKRRCCGRPMISKGMLIEARRNAAHNVELLLPYVRQGLPIIGVEPSCIAAFRDEYPDLLQNEAARLVSQHSFFIEEFLAGLLSRGELNLPLTRPPTERRILLHGHCYQKVLSSTGPMLQLMRLLPNTVVEEIDSGCCGMAGSFGYETEHYDLSLAVGEERLLKAVRAAPPETVIAAAGISCRHQILDGTGRTAVHPIVILAEALRLGD